MEALVALAAIGAASQPLAGKIAVRLSKDDAHSVRYAAAYALGIDRRQDRRLCRL